MFLFYILILAAPMPNHPLFASVIAGMTVVKWLGMICCAYALFLLPKWWRAPAFGKAWETRAFLALFVIAALSSATLGRANTISISFRPMSSYFGFLLLFFVTLCLVNTPKRLYSALLAALAGAAVTSLYVIREYQAAGGTDVRPGFIAGDSNYFATCSVLVIPVAVYFARRKGPSRERWFCIACVALILLAFTLASSRGGLVGLCVEVAYMIVRSGKSRRTALLIGLMVVPLFLFSPVSPLTRMLHPQYGDDFAVQVRRDLWRMGFDMIREHPLTGIGLGNFTAYSYSVTVGAKGKYGMACNTFLEIGAELGFPGLLAYCGLSGAALRSAEKLRAEGNRRKDVLLLYAGEAMQAGLLGFLSAAMFVSAEYQKPFWVFVALTATTPTLLMQKSHRQDRQRVVTVAKSRQYASPAA